MREYIEQSETSRFKYPPGYKIFWLESTEHYQWETDTEKSEIFVSYLQVYRAAWEHYLDSIPPKYCKCGCGKITAQLRKRTKHDWPRGSYLDFVNGHDTRVLSSLEQQRRGQLNDGSALRNTGKGKSYIKYRGNHLHRKVAEEKLGRKLLPGEIVHHKDNNKRNNHPDNIEVLASQSAHCLAHDFGGFTRWNKTKGA